MIHFHRQVDGNLDAEPIQRKRKPDLLQYSRKNSISVDNKVNAFQLTQYMKVLSNLISSQEKLVRTITRKSLDEKLFSYKLMSSQDHVVHSFLSPVSPSPEQVPRYKKASTQIQFRRENSERVDTRQQHDQTLEPCSVHTTLNLRERKNNLMLHSDP